MSDNNKITTLESVGSGIDTTGMVFPQNTDDTFDLDNPISIFECTEEFITSLSREDKNEIIKVLNKKEPKIHFFSAGGLIQPVECFSEL